MVIRKMKIVSMIRKRALISLFKEIRIPVLWLKRIPKL